MKTRIRQIFLISILLFVLAFLPPLVNPGWGSHDRCKLHLLTCGEYFYALKDAIDGARHSIFIAIYLFKTSPYPTNRATIIMNTLIRAARRGVKITLIMERSDDPEDFINKENSRTGLRLQQAGARVFWDRPDRKLHIKAVIIDHHLVFIGSHNLTHSAMKYNQEMSLEVNDSTLANLMIKTLSKFPKTPFRAIK